MIDLSDDSILFFVSLLRFCTPALFDAHVMIICWTVGWSVGRCVGGAAQRDVRTTYSSGADWLNQGRCDSELSGVAFRPLPIFMHIDNIS